VKLLVGSKIRFVMLLLILFSWTLISVPIENAESVRPNWSSPTEEWLSDVWCSGYGWWAVGSYGTILWWNPDISVNDWEIWPGSPTGQTLNSVFMRAQNDGWIVGQGGIQPVIILRYDGTDWNIVPGPGGNLPLIDVWAVANNDAWAVGQNTIARWNGISWSLWPSPTLATFWSIHMVSPSDGWAVGSGGTIIRWNGVSWYTWPSPTEELLFSVYMVDANDGWATGARGTILHWNGGSWETVESPTTQNLYGVTMTSADSGYAVGGRALGGEGTIIRWDGTRWRPCTIPTTHTLTSVDMVSDAIGGWAVGHAGTMVRIPFEIAVQYELTISGAIGSGITDPAPGSHWYDEDSDVSVDAIPDSGWMLDHWLLDGVDVGSADPYTVTMDDDHALTAVFVRIQHELTISVVGSGTTSPAPGSHMYNEGSDVSVDAQPAAGWMLDHWLLDGVDVGSADPYTVTMDDDHALTAVFTEIVGVTYDLTIAVDGSGSTDPAVGVHTYSEGSDVPVTATPDSGWAFDHWLLDGVDVGSADPYTVTMDDDHALTAVFTEIPPTQYEPFPLWIIAVIVMVAIVGIASLVYFTKSKT